jgi:hypothetical protein
LRRHREPLARKLTHEPARNHAQPRPSVRQGRKRVRPKKVPDSFLVPGSFFQADGQYVAGAERTPLVPAHAREHVRGPAAQHPWHVHPSRDGQIRPSAFHPFPKSEAGTRLGGNDFVHRHHRLVQRQPKLGAADGEGRRFDEFHLRSHQRHLERGAS